MVKEKIFIFGGGLQAKLAIDIIEKEGKYDISGILDSFKNPGIKVAGYGILGPIERLSEISRKFNINKGVIAIGDNYGRLKVVKQINNLLPLFEFVTIKHPAANIGSRVQIGPGCIIAAGATVNNDCIIGDHCYLAFKSGLSHDSCMGEFSSLGPGAITGGSVQVGTCSAVAIGANVLNRRKIGSFSVVGAASLIYHDVGDGVVVYGIPAKEVRKRKKDDPYL
ncbi:MAG: acetyltransferase [Eudoraea sp.]|nr:acetyltransferase [Eudoraea sp.]